MLEKSAALQEFQMDITRTLSLFRFRWRYKLHCSFAGMCSTLAGIGTIRLFLVFTQNMVLQDGTL